jgi:hypothetical protein
MIQNGTDIRLNLGGTLIAKLTSNDISLEAEMLDKTDKYSSGWRAVQQGNKQFSMSCEGFIVDPYDKNALLFSENFRNAYWDKIGFSIASGLFADPFGKLRAQRTSGFGLTDSLVNATMFDLSLDDYVVSVWARAVTGTVDVDLEISDSGGTSSDSFTLTTSWQRIFVPTNLQTGVGIEVKIDAGSDGEIDLFGMQLELGQTPTSYEPTGLRFTELFDAVTNGTSFQAVMTDAVSGNKQYIGSVLLNSLSLTAPQGQMCTFSCELTGNGQLT